jgi:hypothetical protein
MKANPALETPRSPGNDHAHYLPPRRHPVGTPVGTPVYVAVEGDRALVRTWDTTGKLKRIRRTPGVEIYLPPSAAGRPGRRSGRVPGFSKEGSLPTPAGCLPGSTRYCTVSSSRWPTACGATRPRTSS